MLLEWELCIPCFPLSSKIFPGPFVNRGRTGRWGRTKISTVNLNTVKQMTDHVVYPEPVTWASADLHECSSTSFSALCLFVWTFFLATQDRFVERMHHSTSPSALQLHPALFTISSWAQAYWCQGALDTAEACWHQSHSQDLYFNQEIKRKYINQRNYVFILSASHLWKMWRCKKNALCEINTHVTIDFSWKRFRLLFLNQRSYSLVIKVIIIFL